MPPKRKNVDQPEGPSARERKKQKIAEARIIPVQAAKPDTGFVSAVAGPSRLVDHTSTQAAHVKSRQLDKDSIVLPSAIDVEKFAEARAFEIEAMNTAMKAASSSATSRAWQALPRHLRRRAASHDVRRVPLRLRDKARSEMDPVQKKTPKFRIPKRGKQKAVSRTESFLKRQRDKTWLETHIWHAKRMHMENMWGYRLAVTPTEKSFRPSHRASIQGSIIHDASYLGTVELKGPHCILTRALQLCCDPQNPNPGASRFANGGRAFDTLFYNPSSYPFNLIAPVTIIWRPKDPDTTTEKGKEKESSEDRLLWVRCHPAAFEDISRALHAATSQALDEAKKISMPSEGTFEVELADLRGQINIFHIVGPKSSQVLKGVLSPVKDSREEFKQFWSSLTNLQTTGSIPRGTVIGFTVNDPRLRFPPKNAKPQTDNNGFVKSSTITFPTATLAQSDIWLETSRDAIKQPKFKKKDLDERRSKSLVPGTQLHPLRQDDRIPVLLIQSSLEAAEGDDRGIHGWTLIIPAGWAMAFWTSLVYTGTRVGGQRECKNQASESGTTFFPRDYPFTRLYEQEIDDIAKEDEATWERKPFSKRPHYNALGTRSPWKPDWDVVLGLGIDGNLVNTQRQEEDVVMSDLSRCPPWVLHNGIGLDSSRLNELLGKSDPKAVLLSRVAKLRHERSLTPLEPSVTAENLWNSALVNVKITVLLRGSPSDMAIIYAISDEEAVEWNKLLGKKKGKTHDSFEESTQETELSEIKPSQDSIIGYVSAGGFSLMRGQGFALGAIPLARLLELRQQSHRLHPNTTKRPLMAKVRNRDGLVCRIVHLEVL